jgi:hypothetical protein
MKNELKYALWYAPFLFFAYGTGSSPALCTTFFPDFT